jgi:hypothetical protein
MTYGSDAAVRQRVLEDLTRRASLRVMASPSPVPPKCCAVVLSTWLNSSNSFACCSDVIPMPVSETANSMKLLPLLTLRHHGRRRDRGERAGKGSVFTVRLPGGVPNNNNATGAPTPT